GLVVKGVQQYSVEIDKDGFLECRIRLVCQCHGYVARIYTGRCSYSQIGDGCGQPHYCPDAVIWTPLRCEQVGYKGAGIRDQDIVPQKREIIRAISGSRSCAGRNTHDGDGSANGLGGGIA